MGNLILFLNAFLSYLFVFVLIIAVVIVACIIGVKWRKNKDAKIAAEAGMSVQAQAAFDPDPTGWLYTFSFPTSANLNGYAGKIPI